MPHAGSGVVRIDRLRFLAVFSYCSCYSLCWCCYCYCCSGEDKHLQFQQRGWTQRRWWRTQPQETAQGQEARQRQGGSRSPWQPSPPIPSCTCSLSSGLGYKSPGSHFQQWVSECFLSGITAPISWKTPGELGVSKSMECDIFPSVLWHCWLGDRKGIRPVKNVGLLVVMIWLELCKIFSSSCHHRFHHPLLQ